jgi:beta-lactamase superfamily II metal-dependent hydrolase
MNRVRGTSSFKWIRSFCVLAFLLAALPGRTQAAGTCGTGSWQIGRLEIHHIDIGQGDSTLIVSPSGRSLLFDAGESSWNSSAKAQVIGPYIEGVLGCKSLDYVVISHFHADHVGYVGYGGLWNLVEAQGFTVGTTLARNYNSYLGDTSGTFSNWKTYLEGTGQTKFHPVTAMEGTSQVNLGGGVTFKIITADGNGAIRAGDFHGDASPPSENDYSIGAVLSFGSFDEWIGGDLDGQYQVSGFGYSYHDIELSAAPEVGDVDVYRADHHGSSHSSSATFINQLDPEVSILSVGNGNTYGHPDQTVMDRLLATSTVYMTERGNPGTDIGSAIVAGNIVIKTTDGITYTVNGTPYTATEPVRVDHDGDGYFVEADINDNNPAEQPAPNGGCDPLYQICSASLSSCLVTTGQVLINEVLPAPANNGTEWVELANTTSEPLNLGSCYLDDIAGGSAAYQIPASTFIPAHGFWTLDRTSYFNNGGDSVRFLKEDGSTLLDSYTYGNTSYDVSWIRFPDGGTWASSPTASTTKGQSNTIPFYPIVSASTRLDENPTSAGSVRFIVAFSKAVTGVNTTAPFSDFTLSTPGLTGSSIASVSGSGTTYTVTVNAGDGIGTLRLDVVDDDSIKDSGNHPLGGGGPGNGTFTAGQTYTVSRPPNALISGNTGLGGVTLSYFDGFGKNIVSGSDGSYTLSVPYGWYGTVTPSQPCYTFNPAAIPYSNITADQTGRDYSAAIDPGSGCAMISATFGGDPKGSYAVPPNGSVRKSFTNTDSGPVKVYSQDGTSKVLASERFIYTFQNSKSYAEMIGYPNDQLATDYWFTWYNNISYSTQLRVSNMGSSGSAEVKVYAGGNLVDTLSIPAGQGARKAYPGLDSGPLHVASTDGVTPILVSERFIQTFGSSASYSEMMGYPGDQLATAYWFPWYNNLSYSTQLRVSNLGSSGSAEVKVYAGSTLVDTLTIPAGQGTRKSYNLDSGPLQVVSTDGVTPILASERFIYTYGASASYAEMMGYPGSQLATEYCFPWYNNTTDGSVGLSSQLRVSNMGGNSASVKVYLAGTQLDSFTLLTGEGARKTYPTYNNGPLCVVSTDGVTKILASERFISTYQSSASYSEMMGYPRNRLDDTYWFPWYNNISYETELRIAKP